MYGVTLLLQDWWCPSNTGGHLRGKAVHWRHRPQGRWRLQNTQRVQVTHSANLYTCDVPNHMTSFTTSLIGDPVDEEDGAIASVSSVFLPRTFVSTCLSVQASGGLRTYASIASHGPPSDHTHQGSPDSHMTQHRDSHERNSAAEDKKPPSSHTVHS